MLKDVVLDIHLEVVTGNVVAVFADGKFIDMVLINV